MAPAAHCWRNPWRTSERGWRSSWGGQLVTAANGGCLLLREMRLLITARSVYFHPPPLPRNIAPRQSLLAWKLGLIEECDGTSPQLKAQKALGNVCCYSAGLIPGHISIPRESHSPPFLLVVFCYRLKVLRLLRAAMVQLLQQMEINSGLSRIPSPDQ